MELVNPVYTQVDNQVTVIVTVKYLDKETKVTQFSQFELALQKMKTGKLLDRYLIHQAFYQQKC